MQDDKPQFQSRSQAGQDRFVWKLLGDRLPRTFLDIGCSHPVEINNTYALEQMGWTGWLVDMDDVSKLCAEHRTAKFIHGDSTKADWSFLHGLSVDYLSLDVDAASLTTLKRIPFDKVDFRVITIEHDRYRFGEQVANEMRKHLASFGYILVCKDVLHDGQPFEDWWVSPFIDPDRYSGLFCESVDGLEIIKKSCSNAIQRYFQKVYLITLPRRRDRIEHAEKELDKCNLRDVTWFDGYDKPIYEGTPNGNMGCTASHRALLELIAFNGYERVLVLEDDFLALYPDVNEKFAEMIKEVPKDFDLLYLGGHYSEPPIARVSPHVIRCGRMSTTSSYAITWQHARRMAPYISGIGPIDCLYSGFAKDNKHYIFQPRLFAQYTSHSDLCDHTRDNVPCMTDTRHENMV